MWWHETERPCGTRLRNPKAGHKRARWAQEPTVAARSMFRPHHETPAIRGLKSSHLVPTNSHRPKRRDPGRQCLPGSHGEIVPGLPFGQPRNSRELGLTHHDFQGAQGCTAWDEETPCVDFQRPAALPRAKGCGLMNHRGAQFTPNLRRVNKFKEKTSARRPPRCWDLRRRACRV